MCCRVLRQHTKRKKQTRIYLRLCAEHCSLLKHKRVDASHDCCYFSATTLTNIQLRLFCCC